MARGIKFEGFNRLMGKPKGMTDEECYTLPVMMAGDKDLPTHDDLAILKFHTVCVSCWELDEFELEELRNNGGKIYLKVVGGQPPVYLSPITFFKNLDTLPFDVPKKTKKDE